MVSEMEKGKANAIVKPSVYYCEGDNNYQLFLMSNKILKEIILINDWIIDVFLTKSEKAYIYRKGRIIERVGARMAAKLAYQFFSAHVDYQNLHIINDSQERPFFKKDDISIDEIKVSLSHTKNYSGAIVEKV